MIDLAIIGGTGLYDLADIEDAEEIRSETPFGSLSSVVVCGGWHGCQVAFLARHGTGHSILPHEINYRANVWALAQLKPRAMIAINAVGSMDDRCPPGTLALPDQLIDCTWGRESSYHADLEGVPMHIDFSDPYDLVTRNDLIESAGDRLAAFEGVVYGVTQGPRLETAAEIRRLISDGCHLVGMTGMPEAVLARELSVPYVSLCVSANWAAGFKPGAAAITMEEVLSNLEGGMQRVAPVLAAYLQQAG